MPPLSEINISKDKIRTVIKKLKRNKSPGPDNLLPRVIKEAMEKLLEPLSILLSVLSTHINSHMTGKLHILLQFLRRKKSQTQQITDLLALPVLYVK